MAFRCFHLIPRPKSPIAAKLKDERGNPIAGTGGLYRATTDPDEICEWWCIKNWPGYCHNYLIGVPMGPLLGLWVLDVDTEVEHDHDGVAAWKALQKLHGIVKVRREHRTSSGGLHLFFEWTEANPWIIAGRNGGQGQRRLHRGATEPAQRQGLCRFARRQAWGWRRNGSMT